MFAYQSPIEIASVALTVSDLQGQVAFYKDKIGLELLRESPVTAELGVGHQVLLTLIKGSGTVSPSVTGLYHTAFLLPSRAALGDVLYHLWNEKVPLIGASDHGYSEAIYLEDPEGNGIEVYADKPISDWERDEAGIPIAKTGAMDVEGVLALASSFSDYRIPEGSRVGHVHLSVKNARQTSQLYQAVFPIQDKLTVPTASFLAGGDYHHHLAVNQWTRNLAIREKGQLGLSYVRLRVADESVYAAIAVAARKENMIVEEQETSLFLKDPLNGIAFAIAKP